MLSQFSNVIFEFCAPGNIILDEPYGNGHINTTRHIILDNNGNKTEYILQRINKNVFKDPESLMENYVGVTEFLRKKVIAAGGDPDREALRVIKAKDGKNFYIDNDGEYWRLILYIVDNSIIKLITGNTHRT